MKKNELFRGVYEIIILHYIEKDGKDCSPYGLLPRINNDISEYTQMNRSTFYDAFRRLKTKGYVQVNENGVFLSENGNEYYKEKLVEWNNVKGLMGKIDKY